MRYTPKPHVSAALAHLRHGITACALVVVAAAVVQMLVFGFVHFTQVRFEEPKREVTAQPLSVVAAPRPVAGAKPAPAAQSPGQPTQAAGPTTPPPPTPTDFRLLSDWDAKLHVMSDMAVLCGAFATVILTVLVFMAVAVAGGACVPGVEKIVGAAGYALFLALMCIPWRDVFTSVPFPGVFSSYQTMTQMSDAVNSGAPSIGLFTMFLLMPLATLAGSFMILGRFRSGVAEGIIVTAPSELDERLEREMAGIRAKGVAAHAPRTVAALNHAIGDAPTPPSAPAPEPIAEPAPAGRRIPGLPAPRGRNWLGRERRIGEPDPGDPLKRPI